MSTVLSINAAKYNDFLRCLTNLKEVCMDVDIRGGYLRQRSNDKTSVFEIDLTPILQDNDMAMTEIKKKLEVLKQYIGQNEVKIEIESGDEGYVLFSDTFTSFKASSPSLSYMDNKFMSQDELESIFSMNDEDLILEYDFSSIITDRIRITTQNFSIGTIQVNFRGEEANIKAITQSKDQSCVFVPSIMTNMIINNSSALISTVPFGIEHDSAVTFKMYKDPNQDVAWSNFSTTLGDVNMTIYTRSSIVADEE
jgi:hypothetical protein